MLPRNQMLLLALFGATILENGIAFKNVAVLNGIGGPTGPFANRNIRSTCTSSMSLRPGGLFTTRRSALSIKASAGPESSESSSQDSLVDKVASKGN
jgi:hypothetical protein